VPALGDAELRAASALGAVRLAVALVASLGALAVAIPAGSAEPLPNSGLRGLISQGPCPGPTQEAGDPPRCDPEPTPF
jgi:hypothetical protein